MRWRALVPAIAAVAAACGSDAYFVCNDDADCGAADGLCEAVGACSFPDPECPSGRRFGDASAPSIAGECTSDGMETSDGTSSTTAPSSTSTSTSNTTDVGTNEVTTEPETTTGNPCPPDWWDCAWGRRVQMRFIDLPEEPLTDFAVLVLLGPPRIDYADLQADGEDIRFVSASGAPLPFEVELWDPQNVSAVWVSVDEVGAASDRFWLYYGNAVAENAQDAAAVWADPYRAVWHMGEGAPDSTGSGNDATAVGTVETLPGQVGSAQRMTNGTSRLTVTPADPLDDVFFEGATVSAWIRPHGWGSNDYGRIVHREVNGGPGWFFYVGNPGQLRFSHWGEADQFNWSTPSDVLMVNRWAHVVATYAVGAEAPARLWVDGVEQEQQTPIDMPVGVPETDAELPLEIGNRPNNDRVFQGRLDEIRIERTVRTAEWIRLQHLSGRDELLAYDPPEGPEAAP